MKARAMQNRDIHDDLSRRLGAALKEQNAAAVDALLRQGAPVDSWAAEVRPPLFMAVETKNPELVKLIAAHSKNPDTQDSCDFTPFTLAVRLGLPEIAHILLDGGASAFPSGRGAEYPLDWAIACGQYGLIGRMLTAWPDRNFKDKPLLVHAAEQEDRALAEVCLKAGAGIDRSERTNGYTALHVAARRGDEGFIRFLLDRGANAEAPDALGQTPVDWAASFGKEKVIKQLLLERDMRRVALEMTEGLRDAMTVSPPYQLIKAPKIQ
jgi:ankyrin repeat protein